MRRVKWANTGVCARGTQDRATKNRLALVVAHSTGGYVQHSHTQAATRSQVAHCIMAG